MGTSHGAVAVTPPTSRVPSLAELEEDVHRLTKRLEDLEERMPEDRVTIVVFSGDLDRVLASFIIATGAAAMGEQVSMFFTFWGLNVLKKGRLLSGKTLLQKMMALMSPRSSRDLPVSRMNYFGVGAKMLRTMMKEKNVSSLEDLITLAHELGVRMIACEMSRDVMGVKRSELAEDLESGGVACFLGDSLKSRTSLFI
jgi:peroxiredoxin family protein